MPKKKFYDVESLRNIFTLAVYTEPNDERPQGHVDIFYLSTIDIDDIDAVTQRIYKRNGNFKGTVQYYNLRDESAGIILANMFGGVDEHIRNAYKIGPFHSDIACKISGEVGEKFFYYLCGYNSYNFDTCMLAYLFSEMLISYKTSDNRIQNCYNVESDMSNDAHSGKITPQRLRDFCNALFANKSAINKS